MALVQLTETMTQQELTATINSNFQYLNQQAAEPPGKVAFFAQSAAPSGWLFADGSAVSRTTYANLYAAIGTTYGAGDGTATFNLPDTRGYFIRALDNGAGIDTSRELGSVQDDDVMEHSHATPWHRSNVESAGYGLPTSNAFLNRVAVASSTDTGDKTSSTGTETRPKNIALLACIKF